jgi:NADPH2:quinone reductase
MKAWLLDQLGSIDDLRLGDAPDPVPEPGEALLRVEFAALNPADRYLAENQYPARPKFPHVLGRDGVGTVVALGPNPPAGAPRVGERRLILRSEVGVNRPGTFAELVSVPVESLAALPADWSGEQSSAAALVYLTAHQALTAWDDLPATNAVVLITGASGGVGVAAVQLARAAGHVVIGLSRDAEKSRKLVDLGAHLVVDPNDAAWPKRVREHLAGRRVDLAVDNIGGPLFSHVLDTLGDRGRVSCVGRLAGPVPEFNTAALLFRRLRVGGIMVGAYTPAESQAAWARVVGTLRAAGATPIVDSVWEFDQLKDAFARLAKGPMGKVVLRVP